MEEASEVEAACRRGLSCAIAGEDGGEKAVDVIPTGDEDRGEQFVCSQLGMIQPQREIVAKLGRTHSVRYADMMCESTSLLLV